MNFQGRLLNNQGAIVPDGYYNIEFKIYQDGDGQSASDSTGSPAGSLLWTEDYVDNNANAGVQVVNGYMSVQLGSICAFGGGSCQGHSNTGVNWDSDTLWLSLNIAGVSNTCTTFGSGSCTADGEMTPMKRLSANAYAMNALNSINSQELGGISSGNFVQFADNTLQADSTANNSIYINKTGTGNIIDFQTSGANSFIINNNGNVVFGANASHTISVATAAASTAGQALSITGGAAGTGVSALTGGNLSLAAGAGGGTNGNGGNLILDAGAANGSGTAGSITIGANNPSSISIGAGNTGAITIQSNSTLGLTASSGITLSNNTTASAQLNVSGSLATKKGTDFATTGASADVNFGTVSLARLTGATAQTIEGIAGGRDGYLLTIINAGSVAATISNQSPSDGTAANRIITSTGSDLSLAVDSSVEMVYDAGTSRWRIVSVSAGTGSYIQNQNASVQTANFKISGTGEADTSLLSPLLDSTGTTLNVGATSGGNATAIALNQNVTVASGKNLTLTSGNATLSAGSLLLTLGNATLTSGNLTLTSGSYSQTTNIATGNASAYAVTDTSATGSTTVSSQAINLTGTSTSGTNVVNGVNFGNVTPIASNNFYALNFGTGFTDLLHYNGQQLISGAGILQNVAISPTIIYSNVQEVGALSVGSIATGFGSISTANAITTTGTVTGGIVNATTTLELAGTSINTKGTLSDVAYLDQNNTFTGANLVKVNSTTAFEVENAGATSTVLTVNTSTPGVGIGTASPVGLLNVEQGTYSSNLAVLSDGVTGTPNAYPGGILPALTLQSSETAGSKALFFGYKNGTNWDGYLTTGECGSYTQMCLDLGSGTTTSTGLENIGTTLNIGGGADGNFTNVQFGNTGSVIIGGTGTVTTSGATALSVTTGGAAAVTVNPGGAAGLNLGTANANAVTIGNASATFAVTSTGGLNVTTGGNISTVGTYNTNTFTSSLLQFAGINAEIDTSGTNGLTVQTNSTGPLKLDTGGAGEVDLGLTNATTVKVGNTSAATTVNGATTTIEGSTINVGTANIAHTINVGNGGTFAQAIVVGSSNSNSSVTVQGGTGTSVSLQSQGGIAIGTNTVAQTIAIGNTTGATAVNLQSGSGAISLNASVNNNTNINTGTSIGTVTIGNASAGVISLTTGSGSSISMTAGATVNTINNTSDTIKTGTLQVQNTGGSASILSVGTSGTPLVTINSTVTGTSGLQFTDLNSSSSASSTFSQLLGVDSSGNVGLSSAGVSLTSPALAYWDGLNNPTTGSQSYPLATVSGTGTGAVGSCTGTWTPTFSSGNGVELNPACANTSGSMNWNFSQVPFEENQFQFKAGTGAADATWFYGYTDSVPTTEYGCNVAVASCNGTTGPFITNGYIVYFSEFHGCIGISYGGYKDGNQCNNGGGTSNAGASPLKSVLASSLGITINDNNFHQVDIQVLDNVITVRWDGQVILTETDVYGRDTSHLNYGFASRSGGSTNTHYIKGLLVTKLGTDVSEYNINDISPMTNNISNTANNMYWQNSTGSLGIDTYQPGAALDVAGTADLEGASTVGGNLTLSSLGSGGTTALCLNATNVVSTCSGGGGTQISAQTATGTHSYTLATAAAGYYVSLSPSSNTVSTSTFNITGVANTEGNVVYIDSSVTKASGTNAATVNVQMNGTQISTVTVATATTVKENYIAMYINGAWRIMGYGNINTTSISTSDTADYAEWIPYSSDTQPQPGDVLSVGDSDTSVKDSSSPYESDLMGVVSTTPYQVGGKDDGHSVILALTGRVPVKVSLENGPIKAGDPLTSSSTPGVAMKATKAGDIIGTALSAYDGSQPTNQIVVQLHVGYDDPNASSDNSNSPKLQSSATAPTATSDESMLGSMYYDTTVGSIQCYEASGWGPCSSSPDTMETISPEYVNAVMHGTGVGTMTSDFCSQTLHINDGSSGQPTICNTNETFNFYKWTSPQATSQTYNIYVTYRLPLTFKSFGSGQTSLMARTDGKNSTVKYNVYRDNTATGLTKCGQTVTASTGSVSDWQTAPALGTSDPASCGFSAGDQILFDIDVQASKDANAYVGNINFIYSNN